MGVLWHNMLIVLDEVLKARASVASCTKGRLMSLGLLGIGMAKPCLDDLHFVLQPVKIVISRDQPTCLLALWICCLSHYSGS